MTGLSKSLVGLAKRVAYFYPLTWLGSLLWAAGLFLLAKAYLDLSPFSLILALAAFFILGMTGIMTRLQANALSKQPLEWDTSALLYAQQLGTKHYICSESMRVWLFFRLHFRIKGKFTVEKNTYYHFAQENSAAGEERLAIPMYFPVCGILQAKGQLLVKDIFGLGRARLGNEQTRALFVRPASGLYRKHLPLLARDGFENTSRKKDTNEEKYYQREYMPGDRFRDINWKVYSRISQLVTKVSLITQEKTRLLVIYFRHYKPDARITAAALAHLNFLKSWLLTFLKAVKKEAPAYNFQIITGQGDFLLESEEDLERFSLELVPLYYQYAAGTLDKLVNAGEVFIFSTPYDTQLPHILSSLAGLRINLFRTLFFPEVPLAGVKLSYPAAPRTARTAGQTAASTSGSGTGSSKAEAVSLSLLRPLLLAPRPGTWLFAREGVRKNPSLPVFERGLCEEVALRVDLF